VTEAKSSDSMTMRGEGDLSPSPLLAFSPSLFVLAGLAALCGALASGVLLQQGAYQPALTAMVLAGAWQVLWSAVVRTNWQPALAAWRSWSHGVPLRRLPYTQAGSDADQISNDLGQFSAWVREWLLPKHGGALLVALAAGIVALVLAMALGAPALLLTVGVVVIGQISLALCAGDGRPASWTEGLAAIGLPFAAGLLALAPMSWQLGLACMVMGIALMGLKTGDAKLLHAGSAVAIAAFVLLREPAAAFVMGVVWASAALLKPAGSRLGLIMLCLAGIALALALL
jgi:hypothetical protein